ncbi:MAG TPA: MGMT family protein [Candidatus Acidoferrum sp.]|nr:MGMT family protein [Candidatus Acidoferrum sp.]
MNIRNAKPAKSSWEPIYRQVKLIPRERVVTYGELARMVRLRGGARVAGYAMAACPSGRGIPWHRVLGAGGRIRLREPVAQLQRRLLEGEGVQFTGNRVDMKAHAWNKRQNIIGHSKARKPSPAKRNSPAKRRSRASR